MGRTEIQVIMKSVKKGYFARGVFDGKGLTVFAGSQITTTVGASDRGNLSILRARHLNEDGRTIEDLYFKSPSAASSFVCGRSSNGWVEWVTPEGVKLSAYRDIDNGSTEMPSKTSASISSVTDPQINVGSHKDNTERILQNLISNDSNVRIDSKNQHTVLYYNDTIVACIYYRTNAIQVEMCDKPAVHALYEELLTESLVYQETATNPYATSGKFSFFVNVKDEETVLLSIMIEVQEGRLTSNQDLPANNMIDEKAVLYTVKETPTRRMIASDTVEKSALPQSTEIAAIDDCQCGASIDSQKQETPDKSIQKELANIQISRPKVKQPQNHSSIVAHPVSANALEYNGRLEKKINIILEFITNMYSKKDVALIGEAHKKEENDKRFRLESTRWNTPMLMLRNPTVITGLIFTLKLFAVGIKGSSGRYRVFFSNNQGKLLSEAHCIEAVAGGDYNCRFELRSSASEEKTVYLVVQSVNAAANEAIQQIEFPVKIAFAADFGL